MGSKRVLVVGDQHLPWHDPFAVNVAFLAAKSVGVDEIVLNGDLLDFYNINSHGPKHPEVIQSLEDELSAGVEFIKALRDTFPKAKIHYNMGNHEDRLDRFIVKNCKVFYNLLTIEKQLNLEKLKITSLPYNSKYQICEGLFAQHSPPSYGQNGARTSLLSKPNASFIYNCTHRVQHATQTDAQGKVHHAWFNGWMGSTTLTKEHARVFSYAKKHENWQQCFSVVDVINNKFFNHQCMIDNGTTTLDGDFFDVT